MMELTRENSMVIRPLCEGEEEEVTLLTCVEGRMGRIWVDNEEKPSCAITLVGDFYFFVGEYRKDEEEGIHSIIDKHCKGKILIIHGKHWEAVLDWMKENYPDSYKSFSRYALLGKIDWFDKDKLKQNVVTIEPEYKVERIDEHSYSITGEQYWTMDFCSNFISKEDFFANGIGYVILKGEEIIVGASTYSYCEGKLEITIETKEEYRKKGLALACASKLILESIERNIYPRWDAANLASVALAEKLGYRFGHEYTAYGI